MEYTVNHNEGNHRFEVNRNGNLAFVEYDLANGVMDICHTAVPVPMEGQGVGSEIMKTTLDYAREHHYKVVPTCPFARAYLLRHKDYKDLTH